MRGRERRRVRDPSLRDVSKAFRDALMGHGIGSPTLECGCGRTNYGDSRDYDDGEKERLDQEAAEHPDRYVYHYGMDGVSGRSVLGRFYVIGCVCEYAPILEKRLWEYRHELVRFIADRNAEDFEGAKKLNEMIATISWIKAEP